jgi:hypothetical protein
MLANLTLSFATPDACAQLFYILERMADEEVGAIMQDRFDAYGEAAAAHLEEMLEDYGSFSFIPAGLEKNKNNTEILVQYENGRHFAEEFSQLMTYCGATCALEYVEEDED